MGRICIAFGALAALAAVAMAAVAAHGLAPAAAAIAESGVQMQIWHALALLFLGLFLPRGGLPARLAAAAFMLGMICFCGAVYALALGSVHLGALAPTGGFLLMAGWTLLALAALRPNG